MDKFFRFILLLTFFASCGANAVVCKEAGTGAMQGSSTIPSSVENPYMLPSGGPQGMVVWESATITKTFTCTNNSQTPLKLWLNPETNGGPLDSYISGVRYKGVAYSQMTNGSPVDTGYTVQGSFVPTTITLTYSMLLMKAFSSDAPIGLGQWGMSSRTFMKLGGITVPGKSYAENVSGSIVVGAFTCIPDISGLNNVVNLPPVQSNQLSTAGKTAGRTQFSISLKQCDASKYAVIYTFNGTPNSVLPSAFSNMGSARGVAVNLGTVDDGRLIAANGENNGNMRIAAMKDKNSELSMFAEYVATGEQVRAGTVTSRATVSVEYL
ncbi:type 1 fimbrial protein [Burkholderia pyrrocinia]|uniref:fimbrial protein n=1 Tax=Burkholderia sp. IT-111MI5 TaxID=3026439 RepID=UPI002A323171|nr:type 1 fimbrial protein [Burkholderia pyrrocinia]EKS9894820.1 type 1 fimbrial protein [Burkholderia pyrrocinia]EKS9907477.1 type 1 fimbrial protein [Burkholderia pyrrocinia]